MIVNCRIMHHLSYFQCLAPVAAYDRFMIIDTMNITFRNGGPAFQPAIMRNISMPDNADAKC